MICEAKDRFVTVDFVGLPKDEDGKMLENGIIKVFFKDILVKN